jgi:hypothetical protein
VARGRNTGRPSYACGDLCSPSASTLEERLRLREQFALSLANVSQPVDLIPQDLGLLERLERSDQALLLRTEHLPGCEQEPLLIWVDMEVHLAPSDLPARAAALQSRRLAGRHLCCRDGGRLSGPHRLLQPLHLTMHLCGTRDGAGLPVPARRLCDAQRWRRLRRCVARHRPGTRLPRLRWFNGLFAGGGHAVVERIGRPGENPPLVVVSDREERRNIGVDPGGGGLFPVVSSCESRAH